MIIIQTIYKKSQKKHNATLKLVIFNNFFLTYCVFDLIFYKKMITLFIWM